MDHSANDIAAHVPRMYRVACRLLVNVEASAWPIRQEGK
jgi:hypothetical protein